MNFRQSFLSSSLREFLARKTKPRGLEKSDKAAAEELASLLATLQRYAPRDGYEDWWLRFSARLDEDAKTRAWPTAGEIKAAAIAVNGTSFKRIAEQSDCDPVKINGARFRDGLPLGDYWVYGRGAVELIRAGFATEDGFARYRSALFHKAKATWGRDVALEKEQEWRKRHAEAARVYEAERSARTVQIPDKRSTHA